jgi:CRP-like cAMP-binding protein
VNDLKTHLAAKWKLTDDEVSTFLSAFDLITLQKGEAFSLPGTVCNQIGLIQSGLMKCVLVDNKKEVIFEFAYENSFIADYYSFVTGTSSTKLISCLEPTIAYVITRQKLAELSSKYAFMERMSMRTNEQLFVRMHEKLTSLLQDSATVRYQKLISSRQDLAQRIPQYLLASYLNVKPETISRIRRRMVKVLS